MQAGLVPNPATLTRCPYPPTAPNFAHFPPQSSIVDEFSTRVATAVRGLRQGPPLGPAAVDCGAMCMPGAAEAVAAMVDDAVRRGAKVLAGGRVAKVEGGGQYYEPTVLLGVGPGMTSINDFATTYMCQSLPFGGVKHSGFGRFAGVEGLRALTVPKAVAEDRQADVRGQERGWQ